MEIKSSNLGKTVSLDGAVAWRGGSCGYNVSPSKFAQQSLILDSKLVKQIITCVLWLIVPTSQIIPNQQGATHVHCLLDGG